MTGRIGSADPATQASPGAAEASPPSGECPLRGESFNVFRCTPDRSLDRYYLRTCAIYRLLKNGHIDKASALEIARRKIRGTYAKPDRLDGTIELWLSGPLRDRLAA